MELPKMPNESKTRNQIQKKSQSTKTVFLQLKNKVDLQIPVIYLTFWTTIHIKNQVNPPYWTKVTKQIFFRELLSQFKLWM